MAQASTTSVPGVPRGRDRACSATLVRRGSTTISSAPLPLAALITRMRCRSETSSTLLPQTTISLARLTSSERLAGTCAESARIGLRADPTTQRIALEPRGPQPVKEAQRPSNRPPTCPRSGVIEGQHSLRPVAIDDGADPLVNDRQRLVPANARETAPALGTHALEGVPQPIGTVHEFRVVLGDLGAMAPCGVGDWPSNP